MSQPRVDSCSDDVINLTDEFEEFHVRSYSGGHLPYDRQKLRERMLQKQNQEEAEQIDQSIIMAQEMSNLKLADASHSGEFKMMEMKKKPGESKTSGPKLHCLSPNSADWEIGEWRPRVYSCPTQKNPRIRKDSTQFCDDSRFQYDLGIATVPLHRVRSFTLTSKGLVSQGDFFRLGSSSQRTSTSGDSFASKDTSLADLHGCYRVAFDGDCDVGKTSIIELFVKCLPPKCLLGECSFVS